MTVDYAYETLASVTHTDMDHGRGELNTALKGIRSQTAARDADLAGEIEAHARGYRALMPGAVLTPTALSKHWHRCSPSSLPSQETNRTAAPTACATCGGDRFVTYSLRAPQQSTWMAERKIVPHTDRLIEEVASCPDCGPDLGARHPDPAQVRERLRA